MSRKKTCVAEVWNMHSDSMSFCLTSINGYDDEIKSTNHIEMDAT